MQKAKDDVDYGLGMKNRRCGICRHYRTGGTCALVEGRIDPDMWCTLFRRK